MTDKKYKIKEGSTYRQNLRLKYPKLYHIWANIKTDCYNPKGKGYEYTGAKGIKLQEDWHKFKNFLLWAQNKGYTEDNTENIRYYIKRKDLNKDYDEINCFITTQKYFDKHKEPNNIYTKYPIKRIVSIYNGMKQRCYNKKVREYKNYGARGIKMCEEWNNKETGLNNFYNWAINNGYKDNLSIDRIDVNGNYDPQNCRWATLKEQANNRRNNTYIEFNGKKYTISELAEEYNINVCTLSQRLFCYPFWDIEKALFTPVKKI